MIMSPIKILPRKEVSMEGHLVMSEKERERLVVMARVSEEELTIKETSEVLSISYRQAKGIYSRYKKGGARGLIHKSCGRMSNRDIETGLRNEILLSCQPYNIVNNVVYYLHFNQGGFYLAITLVKFYPQLGVSNFPHFSSLSISGFLI